MSAPVQLELAGLFADAATRDDTDDRRASRRADMLRDLTLYCAARPDTYMDRWRWSCLAADEHCPGCGFVFAGAAYDSTRMHYLAADVAAGEAGPIACRALISRNRRHGEGDA